MKLSRFSKKRAKKLAKKWKDFLMGVKGKHRRRVIACLLENQMEHLKRHADVFDVLDQVCGGGKVDEALRDIHRQLEEDEDSYER